ncbi:MAG: hypothetical protein ACXAC8_16285 [Candidatus Hodarchaeales archaeon]|jgi:DNA-binding transcriptional ArsR family regulator
MKSSNSKTVLLNKKNGLGKLPRQLINHPLKKDILDHWRTIPAIIEIVGSIPARLTNQEIRSSILDILREGIEEYDDSDNIKVVRHVFSVKELHKLIKKRISSKIKISNVYFHLHKLEEHNYIKSVGSTTEGRQTTHYYGRTARLFLYIGEGDETKNLKLNRVFQNIYKLLIHFNRKLTSDSIQELFSSIVQSQNKNHESAKKWIEANEDILLELNIDIREIYLFLRSLNVTRSEIISLNDKVAKLLNFPMD